MKKFQIPKMEENSNLNRGELFEKTVKLAVDPSYVYYKDSTPFWLGSDIPELKASVKLVNDCTLCKSPENLEEAVKAFIVSDYSKFYLLGFDMIDENNYHILELNKLEMHGFLGEYGRLSKASAQKNHATILKIRLRSKKAQKAVWEKMEARAEIGKFETRITREEIARKWKKRNRIQNAFDKMMDIMTEKMTDKQYRKWLNNPYFAE